MPAGGILRRMKRLLTLTLLTVLAGGASAQTAQEIINKVDATQKAAKDLVEAIRDRPIDAQLLEETAQRIARQRTTTEAKGGIGAFLEKRPAPWLP